MTPHVNVNIQHSVVCDSSFESRSCVGSLPEDVKTTEFFVSPAIACSPRGVSELQEYSTAYAGVPTANTTVTFTS